MKKAKRILAYAASAVLLLNVLGCSLLQATPVAWSLTRTPSVTPVTPTPPLPNLTPLPLKSYAGTSAAAAAPTGQSSEKPTWLVYSRRSGKILVALKANQAQPVTIELPEPLLSANDIRAGASPNQEWLAVRTGKGASQHRALRLIHLPDGSIEEISALLSPQQESPGATPSPITVLAISQDNNLSWSPNGRYLAFIAAADGPSADLYVFDLQTHKTSRLTSGSNQAATPTWSPDSRWIITQEIESFGNQGSWRVSAVWAAAVGQSEIRRLYTPSQAGTRELFLGWTDAETLVVATQTQAGIQDIREIPLSTRWLNVIYKGPCETTAFDPASRWLYFTQSTNSPAQSGQATGLFRISASGGSPEQVIAGEWRQVTWQHRVGLFIASGVQGVLLIKPDGQANLIKNESNAAPSPDGLWIAGWGDTAVHLYQRDGRQLQEVQTGSAQLLLWTPDSSGFYFQSGSTLFYSSFPNPEPRPVDADVLEMGAGLVPASQP